MLEGVIFEPVYYTVDWSQYLFGEATTKPNMHKVPVNKLNFNDEGIKVFNEVYQYCVKLEDAGLIGRFVTTKSGGISIKKENLRGPKWEIYLEKAHVELRLRNLDGRYYRFIIGHKKQEQTMTGGAAFAIYKRIQERFGVDLEDFAIDNGLEVKETIPKQMVDFERAVPDRTYENVHHIDLNSAYNAGMMLAFPALEPGIRYMYNLRKEHKEYKNVLNMTQGIMQSKYQQYRFAHISKSGYEYTNNTIEKLSKELMANGRRVLAYNTDGIWYQGDIYHNENEGTDIGQWKNDHINCKIRWKSPGAYEYIENGIYKPVLRGQTTYELQVPREEWVWGDIYKGGEIAYEFIEKEGFKLC